MRNARRDLPPWARYNWSPGFTEILFANKRRLSKCRHDYSLKTRRKGKGFGARCGEARHGGQREGSGRKIGRSTANQQIIPNRRTPIPPNPRLRLPSFTHSAAKNGKTIQASERIMPIDLSLEKPAGPWSFHFMPLTTTAIPSHF